MRADRLSIFLTYAMAALGVVPVLLYVSPVYALVLATLVGIGLCWDLAERHPLSSWLINLLVLVGLLVALGTPSAAGAIGRLLSGSVVLMGAKLLAPKTARDMLQVMLLSLVLLIGSAMISVSATFGPLFMGYLVLCTLTLLWLPFGTTLGRRIVPQATLKRVGSVGLALMVGSLPFVLLFFLALPRTQAPLWRGAVSMGAEVTGFSDSVSLGSVSRIAQSPAIAFRAELPTHEGPLLPAPYWRGLVLENADGFTWTRREPLPEETLPRGLSSTGAVSLIEQLIYLEPHGQKTLFGLDRIALADDGISGPELVHDGAVQATRAVTRRLLYRVSSDTSPYSAVEPGPMTLAANLAVPSGLPPIVAQTARDAVGDERDPYRITQLLLEHFAQGDYTYALRSPEGDGHPLKLFLEQRVGYCEYFASTMALMLRMEGVPARVVAGYLGGDYNPTGDYYLVRQLSAHTWVEAYIPGKGWLRLDPTPPGQGPAAPGVVETPSDAFMLLDWARLRWQALVLGYDLDMQTALFASVAAALAAPLKMRLDVDGLGDAAALLLLVAALLTAALLWRRVSREGEEAALYSRLLRRLRRRGLERGPAEGPQDFAARAAQALPSGAVSIEEITVVYLDARYGGRPAHREVIRRLERSVKAV
ncbi:MAG: DUF3488 and transglutaminase-like domain-containing protein [Actinobacteria bacterium]|nr:DUF3488 and transglutaminase-like domain-containing protein [Actinomycetota bacterium]